MNEAIDAKTLTKIADVVLQNPLLMLQLRDQVYELMLDDLRYQYDRVGTRRITIW